MSLGKKHLLAVLLAALALLAWSLLGSKYALEVTNYVLSSPKLTAPIRVVQLTDLHNSEFEGNIVTEYEKKFSDQGFRIYRLEAYLPVRSDGE